jgi:hypothetical protein
MGEKSKLEEFVTKDNFFSVAATILVPGLSTIEGTYWDRVATGTSAHFYNTDRFIGVLFDCGKVGTYVGAILAYTYLDSILF